MRSAGFKETSGGPRGGIGAPQESDPNHGPRAQADHLCDSFEFAAAKDLVVTNLDGWNPGLFGVAGSRTPVRGRTREVSGKKNEIFFVIQLDLAKESLPQIDLASSPERPREGSNSSK